MKSKELKEWQTKLFPSKNPAIPRTLPDICMEIRMILDGSSESYDYDKHIREWRNFLNEVLFSWIDRKFITTKIMGMQQNELLNIQFDNNVKDMIITTLLLIEDRIQQDIKEDNK